MARLADLKLSERLFMQTYRYRSADWRPGARLRKPLSETRLALISSAGLYLPGQEPFDLDRRGGDWSFREIPAGAAVEELRIAQRSTAFDQRGALQDRNLVFPLDRLHSLAAAGELGALSPRHFSLMGSITAPGRLVAESAPAVAARLREDGADAALLVPV